MRLALVSAFLEGNESGITGHEAGLEYSYERAFLALGHEIVRIRDSPKEIIRLPGALSRIEAWTQQQFYLSTLCENVLTSGVDLAVVIKGRGVTGGIVRKWRRAGIRVVTLMPDNPFEAAAVGLGAPGLLEQYRAVDLVLVHDRIAVGQLRECQVRSEFIAFARDPVLHSFDSAGSREPEEYQLVFVGNLDSDRVRYLTALSDLGLAVFGSASPRVLGLTEPLRRCVRGGPQYGDAMVSAMRKAQISINIFRCSQKSAHNMRTFEIPACGVCCLSEFSIGAAELMQEGKEVEMFRTPQELRKAAIRLLQSPGAIQEIAAAAEARTVNETYQKRATELLQLIDM